jgi:hypothetical protein
MGATGFRIDGRTIAPIRRKIAQMRERSTNLTPAWQVFADWFADQNRVQFGSRGARWRTLWPELASATLDDKLREGYPTDMMRRTRQLERSLTDRPLAVERLHPHEMTVGTNLRYAHFHQTGTRRMPARPLISARQVANEGALSAAVASWIARGRPEVGARRRER